MATATFVSVVQDLEPCGRAIGQEYLQGVSSFVLRYKYKKLPLKKPAGATLKICELEDTIYRDRPDEVNGWGKFYLRDMVNMRVVGVVEGTSCPAEEFVLMTCEDKKLYGYDGETLHVVASNLSQAVSVKEINYPASERYYNGEAFRNMTERDWKDVKKGPVGQRLDEDYKRMVQQKKRAFMQSLKSPVHS